MLLDSHVTAYVGNDPLNAIDASGLGSAIAVVPLGRNFSVQFLTDGKFPPDPCKCTQVTVRGVKGFELGDVIKLFPQLIWLGELINRALKTYEAFRKRLKNWLGYVLPHIVLQIQVYVQRTLKLCRCCNGQLCAKKCEVAIGVRLFAKFDWDARLIAIHFVAWAGVHGGWDIYRGDLFIGGQAAVSLQVIGGSWVPGLGRLGYAWSIRGDARSGGWWAPFSGYLCNCNPPVN